MKKFYLVLTVFTFLISNYLFGQTQQSITFTSPTMNEEISGGSDPSEIPVTLTYNSVKDNYSPSSIRVEYIQLITEDGVYYDDIGHGIPSGETEMPEEWNLEPGTYHWILVQYEKYLVGGIQSSCSTEVYFDVKHTLEVKTDKGGIVKVDFHTKNSGHETLKVINESLYIEAPDQEISTDYYVWGSNSKWTVKKLNADETTVSIFQFHSYHVQSDDNKAVLKAYLKFDEEPPATPQNVAVQWSGDHPVVSWSANTEPDLNSYKVAKRVVNETGWAIVATVSNSTTSWTDTNVDPAGKFDPLYTLEYKVLAVDINENSSSYSSVTSIIGTTNYLWKQLIEDENKENIAFQLFSNYPNPFNPTTQINYQIPNYEFVTLKVYNSLGEEIKILVNRYQSKGQYSVTFNASILPSGVYIYKLQSGEFSSTQKMLLTK